MKKIKEIVVVEGKTDTALLKELFEVDTIETHGLALDQQTLELIQEASKSRGIIVLTDPDFPGKKIRHDNCSQPFCQLHVSGTCQRSGYRPGVGISRSTGKQSAYANAHPDL